MFSLPYIKLCKLKQNILIQLTAIMHVPSKYIIPHSSRAVPRKTLEIQVYIQRSLCLHNNAICIENITPYAPQAMYGGQHFSSCNLNGC